MSLCPYFSAGDDGLDRWLERALELDEDTFEVVKGTLHDVRDRGSEAVLESAKRFDSASVTSAWVSEAEMSQATVPEHDLEAIKTSIEAVREFHQHQLEWITEGWEPIENSAYMWGVDATGAADTGFEGQKLLPVGSAGIYVPGGRASYPSSVIMNAIPAQVAGVGEITLATPAASDGGVHPAVLVAARELGLTKVLKCGGAAAIGAFAYGLDGELDRVDVIAGPGNKWVNEAKRQLWGRVGLDLYAGPSEVCVVADETCRPIAAAADWLTQVEHAPDNVGMLIASSRDLADRIVAEAEKLIEGSYKEQIIREALRDHGCVVISPDTDIAVDIVNRFAPEHLTLMVAEPDDLIPEIKNAGCILVGAETPQSAGDFVTGPSHTLPTGGAARFASPVNVMTFMKFQSVSSLTLTDLRELLPTLQRFGKMEGFPIHAQAAEVRFQEDKFKK